MDLRVPEHQEVKRQRLSPLNFVALGGLVVAGLGYVLESAPITTSGFIGFFGGVIGATVHERHLNS